MSDTPDPTDPTQTLEPKIVAFAATLSDDELTVLHDVLHLAREGSKEVAGYVMPAWSADPCEGGEITFPNTLAMLGSLHVSLHRRGGAGRPKVG